MNRIVMTGIAVLALTAGASAAESPAGLSYSIDEGRNLNLLYRQGPVAADIIARSGTDPRLIVAFPAGNSGTGLWFKPLPAQAQWHQMTRPKPVRLTDSEGRPLYGVEVELESTAPQLVPAQAVLSSVRVLRDYESLRTVPDGVQASAKVDGNTLTYARNRLDGKAGYRMSLVVEAGRLENGAIVAPANGPIRIKLVAASGEAPLAPLSGQALLNGKQQPDENAIRALTFLSYKEKFLAGSWRFNTYFGRDTLMSIRLLMPVLAPNAVETGLRAVLTRLSPQGEVAHEEDIGEFAVLDHRRKGEGLSDAPVYDYKMVDGDFMLAPVMAHWLSSDPDAKGRAKSFLAEPNPTTGLKLGDALVLNLRHVVEQARPFAENPAFNHLVGLKPGVSAGEWRDSTTGLGGGQYPYDVNAVFVPAALRATAKLLESGLLDPYLTAADRRRFAYASRMAAIWSSRTARLFEAEVPAATAERDIRRYAGAIKVPAEPALLALHGARVRFMALALNADGTPVRVENSDVGFALLFAEPSPAALAEAAEIITRPFPAGLMTGAGMLVANPAFAFTDEQKLFTSNAYHGTVIWSWQQAIAAAGLARQLARNDLPDALRRRLQAAQIRLWAAIDATRQIQGSELWSWSYSGGRYSIVPFGAAPGDADESNAVQLWSTVFLALHSPVRETGTAAPPPHKPPQ